MCLVLADDSRAPLVRDMLQAGASPDVANFTGATPVMIAVANGKQQALEVLVLPQINVHCSCLGLAGIWS